MIFPNRGFGWKPKRCWPSSKKSKPVAGRCFRVPRFFWNWSKILTPGRVRVQQYLSLARESIQITPTVVRHATHLRDTAGLGRFDALHLACAKKLRANVFLTTDDRLLRAARRLAAKELLFAVSNPLVWLTAFLEKE